MWLYLFSKPYTWNLLNNLKKDPTILISLRNVEVGINMNGMEKLQNKKQTNMEVGILELESSPFVFK